MKYLFAAASVCAVLLSTACTQSPEKLIATANKWHQNKKYKEASILYQKAIAKDKTNAEAYYREGLNLLDAGSGGEAIGYLRRAVDLNPANTDAETKLAELYLTLYSRDSKKFKTLLPDIRDLSDKVTQHQPNSFEAARLQAFVYLTENNAPKALEGFARANRIRPYSREVVGWYYESLMGAQRTQEAEALLRDMIAHDKTWGPAYDFLFVQYIRGNKRDQAEALLRQRVQNDPSNAKAIVNLASFLVQTGRAAEGEAIVSRMLNDKKTFPAARETVGDFYFREKKFDQALQQYQAGAREDEKNSLHYQQRVATVYVALNRRADALQLIRTLATKNPKDASMNEMYASLLLGSGTPADVARSLAELKTLAQNNPTDAVVHLDLARAYFAMNDTDKALNEALEALQEEQKVKPPKSPRSPVVIEARTIAGRIEEDRGDHAKAMEQADAVLAMAPKNADARLIRDRALVGINQPDRAQSDLEALIQEYPTQQYPQMKDARLELGNVYLNQGQYDKAAQQYDLVWKSNPPDERGFLALQTVKLAQGKPNDAVKAVQDLVDRNPQDLRYRYQLAGIETTAGTDFMKSDQARAMQLFQQAADNYKAILKTTANSSEIWLRLGFLQRQLKQYDAALASFEQSSNADPRNSNAILNQGMLFDDLGKRKQAVDAYNKVLGLDPKNAIALNNLAFIDAEEKTNLDQAMSFAERAKKEVPTSPEIDDTLGYVYYQKNLNAEALRIFRQNVQTNPKNPTFHFHLAMALQKDGDKAGARDEAEKALKISSQPDQQDKIRSFLNQLD